MDGRALTLQEALQKVQDGDRIILEGGVHQGNFVIRRSVVLEGDGWPVLDGQNRGTVLKIEAPGVVVRRIRIRNSGDVLAEENSGIAIEAPDVRVEEVRLDGTLFGIYLRYAHRAILRRNIIVSKDLPLARRGDPIRVWYSNDVRIEDNVISRGRDVVLWYSERLTVVRNRIEEGRYGVHLMYCDDAWIEENVFSRNSVGAFLMYSRRLRFRGNRMEGHRGPSGFGIGLKDVDNAEVWRNWFVDNRVGLYNDTSPREVNAVNRIYENLFTLNDYALWLLPSTNRTLIWRNAFVENVTQVAIEGGGPLPLVEWAVEGSGNYWSDYAGLDLDGDGRGDWPYRYDRYYEILTDRFPALQVFRYAPAARVLDWMGRAFPLIAPEPKLTDPYPLVESPVPLPAQEAKGGEILLALLLVALPAVFLR